MTITTPAPSPGLPYDRLTPRAHAPAGTGRLRRVVTGSPDDPRWARPALLSLLTATGLLYIVNLAASGYANAFYSAAVQAGSTSWKAFFFGSFDGVELHHRRQAAGLAVGDGPVGAHLRRQLLEHPRSRRR
jgi:hypothetical protein